MAGYLIQVDSENFSHLAQSITEKRLVLGLARVRVRVSVFAVVALG